ncbi:formylglycine-generating enzyme family protein [Desulfococcaceae bacterium HSG9]|nr:formylglycine-generating enzyme family protein [Desulfococcaceae bacterium HSG9]
MKCPICNENCKNNETFCSQCSWEFKIYVGGTPPEEEQHLKIAKRNWHRILAGTTSNAEPEKPHKITPQAAESVYSENTPVPDLKRDAFETVEEFQKRITDHKPVLAGQAELLKNKYDINTGVFPVKILWQKWAEPFVTELVSTQINAERDLARAIYESGRKHPVYARLQAEDERAVLELIELVYAPDKAIRITGEIKLSSTFENSLGMKFVYIAPGTFIMGSPEDEPGREDDEIQHKVTLIQGFYLQSAAVTVGQWRKFAKSGYKSQAETEGGTYTWTGKDFKKQKDIYWNHPSFKQTDDHPVTWISWNDVQAFIKWLSAKEKQAYRLPTEAEWEYACRAGTLTLFAFGNCLSTDQANYDGNSPLEGCPKGVYRERTVPADSFAPNAWGLYNMHGNVWEWCQDWYGDYPSESVTDPQEASSGALRVLRGGSWGCSAGRCRPAARGGGAPDRRDGDRGFRLVLLPGQ